jgi:anthranilate synthase component 1
VDTRSTVYRGYRRRRAVLTAYSRSLFDAKPVAKLTSMAHIPDFEQFQDLSRRYDVVVVYRRLISDSLTPVSAFRRIDTGECACLFESVIGGEKVGRYSILAVQPNEEIEARGNQLRTYKDGHVTEETVTDPLNELRDRLGRKRIAPWAGLAAQPLIGGAIGYVGYDVVRYTEHLPNAPRDDRHIPDMSFAFYDRLIIFDNVTKVMVVSVAVPTQGMTDPRHSYQEAVRQVDELVDKLSHPGADPALADIAADGESDLEFRSNFDQPQFEQAVNRCVEYIQAGDVFQVVLSQRLEVEFHDDPFELYRTLRIVNPSPFMFFLRTRATTLIGSSPEIMCRVMNRRVTVRPLAGTRRRGATLEEDRTLAEELLADPKERAEHVMLVDLGRNDVGRIAKYGTVKLDDVMVIERYSHVMHITSNVSGDLADGKDAFDALRACLPAGTVSGAPKVRAMQIIDELEPHRRGPYAGAVGYIDYGGNMDTCIALRTIVLHGTKAYVQAGAGIVADSVPANEYQETLNKARGLLRSIDLTLRRTGHGKK